MTTYDEMVNATHPWHSRAVWWCWIVNDPFMAEWWRKEQNPSINGLYRFRCPLCDMKAQNQNPNEDETFMTYHRFAGTVSNPFVARAEKNTVGP